MEKSHSSKEASFATTKGKGQLTEAEGSASGSVEMGVYYKYIRSIGLTPAIVVLISFIASNGLSVGSGLWLSAWADDSLTERNATDQKKQTDLRLGVYGGIGTALLSGASAGYGKYLDSKALGSGSATSSGSLGIK